MSEFWDPRCEPNYDPIKRDQDYRDNQMNNFIPDAPFDAFSEPSGDKRWWYTELYKHFNLEWMGREPDRFSPHNLVEENQINLAILEGRLEPRNQSERLIRDLIDKARPKAQWPQKWVTCRICKSDWRPPGYPAGKQTKFTDAINSHQLIDSAGYIWLWPNLCQPCADRREAKLKPAKAKTKLPYKDPPSV